MKFAAFFRNLNLGRANCPDRAQFEQAFLDAGADSAASFLVNGTLVYTAPGVARAKAILKAAAADLQAGCGLAEPGYIRRVDHLAGLVAAEPFAGIDRGSVYECCISFLAPRAPALPPLPLQSRRGDIEILQCNGGEVFSLSRKIGNTPGSPNAWLEKTMGLPATTRAWNTIVRLVDKHA
jgi:uncharacterized protein (DUF1697 family)